MSVVIRLAKMGRKGENRFRVVVKEKRSRRNGKPIETLGWYEKRVNSMNKKIDKARYDYWISKGAQPTPSVTQLLKS
ncbi:MAG: 30S ribosomal protein S16 [Candidatus Levybacteria bacterium]|nr:30S ribosomal protein S16 [Candidatus Levybacteria bacterium]